jgi:anti-sigma B factor antagonist
MEITMKELDDVRVVVLEGNMDTNTSPDAEIEINKLIESGATKIIINFESVDYISSAGLRVLLATAKKLKSVQGDLKICCLNSTVQEVFDISGFASILSVFGQESEALGAF